MSRNHLFSIIFSFFIVIISCSISAGQPTGSPCGKPWKTPLSEIKGKIKDVYYAVPRGTQKEGLHLKVKTSPKKTIIVHVFPKRCIANNPEPWIFKKGDSVTVSGSEFRTKKGGIQLNICAAEIISSKYTFKGENKLRDSDTGDLNKKLCSRRPDTQKCEEKCKGRCNGKGKPDKCMRRCLAQCGK